MQIASHSTFFYFCLRRIHVQVCSSVVLSINITGLSQNKSIGSCMCIENLALYAKMLRFWMNFRIAKTSSHLKNIPFKN